MPRRASGCSSGSAGRIIRRITAISPGASTSAARSSTPSASAISRPGLDLDDRIEGTSGRIVWSGDSRQVFYVQLNENHRPSKLYRHRLGTPAEKDQLVYEEADPGFFLGVGLTQSRPLHPDRQPRPRDLGGAGASRPMRRRCGPGWWRSARPASNMPSRRRAASSTSSPMPMGRRISRSSPRRCTAPAAERAGRIWCLTNGTG